MDNWHCPVAAIIVEPIQSEGGDNHASPRFFQALQDIASTSGAVFIVDEVQTGVGSTGKFWAHEHWNLPSPPDIVTFSKKFQAAGYYFSNPELRPQVALRLFNTWLGDPCRAILAKAIIEEIDSRNLIAQVQEVGEYMQERLAELAKNRPGHLINIRGQGTMIAWDEADTEQRNSLVTSLRRLGVIVGTSGDATVRLRPMLIFEKKHADILLSALAAATK